MSGFDARWLDLRADADRRSRSASIARRLDEWLARRAKPARIVDLGCGTGANLRCLAPQLDVEQRWTCIDDDEALLTVLRQREVPARVRLECRREDLSRDVGARLREHSADVLTGSALIDLVSRDWLLAVVAEARAARAAVLFTLSYDGRLRLHPAHAADEALRDAFNAHQRRDKGFGAALGPAAGATLGEALRTAGFDVHRETSDWRLEARDAGDAALLRPLLGGIAQAAAEQAPAGAAAFASWLAERLAQCDGGELTCTIGHDDTLGLPGARQDQ